jgi:acyl-CoA synthetase (AMP-forming)/AMP-acid ligase II
VNITMLLDMVADGAPDRLVLGSRHGTGYTAAELRDRARRAARLFRARGVERVGFVDANSVAFPIALFGAGYAGLPFAPINYRLADEQLRAILERITPAVVVVGDDIPLRIGDIEGLQLLSPADLLAATDAEAVDGDDDDDEAELPFVDPDEIAVLLFTSGTTGEPKAAVLRHRHLTSYIISTVEYLAADDDDAQLVSVPAYHVAGVSAVLSSLYGGRRIAYLPGFDPDAWVAMVHDERITQAMVVPTMLGRVLTSMEESDADLSSLRHLSYGGGRMPLDLIQRAMKLLPEVNFVNAYGLTETSSTISVLTPDDHRAAAASPDEAVRKRLTSVGRPLDTLELEIRDAEGNALGPNEPGEIFVRGEQVAGEYLGRSVLTDDGWFPTNDAGYLDDDGFLFLDGRLDDVIVRGAENLSPGEIETTLLTHPAVVEAAVVGVPDPEWGEAVAAAIVLDEGATVSREELQQWVRERLRSTKTPQLIQFRDEMPYNETGKLLRRVIKQELGDGG